MTAATAPSPRWTFGPGTNAEDRPAFIPVPDAVLVARWERATWPGGNVSELALRLYALIDELAGEVADMDPKSEGFDDEIRSVLEMDALEHVIGEWILERVAKVGAESGQVAA